METLTQEEAMSELEETFDGSVEEMLVLASVRIRETGVGMRSNWKQRKTRVGDMIKPNL